MKSLLILPALLAAGASGACLPVQGDQILGRDLALADRQFSALPATLQIGYAPAPGSVRVFAAAELQRIARTNAIALTGPGEVCFEIPVHTPAEEEFAGAMRQSLPKDAALRIVEIGRVAIPAGRIDFPLSGLEPLAAGNAGYQLWRGAVQYTGTRRVAIWARVEIGVTYKTLIARRDLSADTPLDPSALRVETKTGPLRRAPAASSVEDVAGHVLRRAVKTGEEIPLSLLREAPAVRRGDSVKVEVQSGMAVLRFDAIALAAAGAGEVTELRNPLSGKVFRARITGGSGAGGATAVIVVGKDPSL
jgi:flagella basal body P-ring formation protein FlgA